MNLNGYFFQPAPAQREFPSHVQWSGDNRILSPPECDHIISLGETNGFAPASIGSPDIQRVDPAYRCVEVSLLPYSPISDWLYQRITGRVQSANDAYFNFDLAGLLEPLQILRYKAPEQPDQYAGHYDWHQDFGAGYMSRRKVSVVIQLSDGADYQGCTLTLQTHKQEPMNYRRKGEGAMFPSWTPHMVTNCERGTRYALVAWVHGTPFR